MAENKSSHTSKSIRVPCTLEVGGRLFLKGETRELTERQATLHIPALAMPGANKIGQGTKCILSLAIRTSGGQLENLKISCNSTYVAVISVGLNLNIDGLDSKQRDLFDTLLNK